MKYRTEQDDNGLFYLIENINGKDVKEDVFQTHEDALNTMNIRIKVGKRITLSQYDTAKGSLEVIDNPKVK